MPYIELGGYTSTYWGGWGGGAPPTRGGRHHRKNLRHTKIVTNTRQKETPDSIESVLICDDPCESQ